MLSKGCGAGWRSVELVLIDASKKLYRKWNSSWHIHATALSSIDQSQGFVNKMACFSSEMVVALQQTWKARICSIGVLSNHFKCKRNIRRAKLFNRSHSQKSTIKTDPKCLHVLRSRKCTPWVSDLISSTQCSLLLYCCCAWRIFTFIPLRMENPKATHGLLSSPETVPTPSPTPPFPSLLTKKIHPVQHLKPLSLPTPSDIKKQSNALNLTAASCPKF